MITRQTEEHDVDRSGLNHHINIMLSDGYRLMSAVQTDRTGQWGNTIFTLTWKREFKNE